MAYIVATGNTPQTQRVRELKDALILAYNAAARINRELDQMSDEQVERALDARRSMPELREEYRRREDYYDVLVKTPRF